jgi:hypothetical protein
MKDYKKGEYLAPEAGVMTILTDSSMLSVSGGNEGLLGSGYSYGEGDFD